VDGRHIGGRADSDVDHANEDRPEDRRAKSPGTLRERLVQGRDRGGRAGHPFSLRTLDGSASTRSVARPGGGLVVQGSAELPRSSGLLLREDCGVMVTI
jgi:hypothetical protein